MSNERFIVFGATGGIGREVCRRLTVDGGRIVAVARNEERLQEMATKMNLQWISADATSFTAVEQCVGDAENLLDGKINGIVNTVGSVLLKPAHLTSETDWQETIALNLTSSFAVVRAGCRAMHKTGGTIVLSSSAAGRTGLPNHDAIAAAKAGVIGLTRSSAASYASRGIRVNAVAPGLVKTPLTQRIWSSRKSAEVSEQMHPLGRLGEPSDVASLIAWLLKTENAWVTGQVFGIDGGLATIRNTTG